MEELTECLKSVQEWMDGVKLKLNPEKNEFRCRPMSVTGLSLLGLKRIRGFVSILCSINPTIIIIIQKYPKG